MIAAAAPPGASAEPSQGLVDAFRAAVAEDTTQPSLLENATPSVDPFISNQASAVIARPSLSQMFDSAIDFNDKEGTLGLRVSPALLVTPYPDWYLTGLSLSAAANTEEKEFSVGGKWDFNFRDTRFYYALHKDEMLRDLNEQTVGAGCESIADDLKLAQCRSDNIEKYLHRYRAPIALSIGGNATYDDSGRFGGGNATLAFDAKYTLDADAKPRYPVTFSAAANAKYEDAPPSDEEEKQLKKAGVDVGDHDRGQKAGGGLDLAVSVGIDGKNRNERSLELGIGAAALACLDGICDKLDNGSSVKVNPYLSVAITKSIGGRIDVVWDGTGHKLGDAFAGASLKYSFSRPKEVPPNEGS